MTVQFAGDFHRVVGSEVLLGIDVGTSACKALLIDADGVVAASAMVNYSMSTPRPQWAEQNPDDWWRAAVSSIRQVLHSVDPRRVVAIGLTGQMHGLVLLDERGSILRPCIMWNDQRAGRQCQAITTEIGGPRLLDLVGNPMLPGFTAPKIVWVRENEPDVYARVARVLLPKDYLRYRLTGVFVTEMSDASGTALLDIQHRRWSSEILDALDIPSSWLPECFESVVPSACISHDASEETGLPEGIPVVGGGGDQAAQAVGSGVISDGIVSVTLGTSGVVFAASRSYRRESSGRLHAFCHAVPNRWHAMGVMLSAAGSLRWFRDALAQPDLAEAQRKTIDVYDLLTAQASTVTPGSEGLIYLPYLSGERTPYPDPDARGVFFGLTLRHQKAHLIRAVLEAVAYGLRDSLELTRTLGLETTQVRVSGGGARSPLWRQILADVFDTEIALVNVVEGAAYGAAVLASVGAGLHRTVDEACARMVQVVDRVEPGENAATYADYYPIYRALYPSLAPHFRQIGAVTARHLDWPGMRT